jgi:hypothetical protein
MIEDTRQAVKSKSKFTPDQELKVKQAQSLLKRQQIFPIFPERWDLVTEAHEIIQRPVLAPLPLYL